LLPVAGIPPRAMVVLVVLVVPPAPEPEPVVGVGVAVGVTHGSTTATRRDGPGPAVGVLVGPAVGVLVGVLVGVAVGVLVGVAVGVLVGVAVGVLVGVAVGDAVGLLPGVAVGVTVAIAVGVTVGVMHVTTAAGRAPTCPDTTRVNDNTTAETRAALVMCFLIAQSHQHEQTIERYHNCPSPPLPSPEVVAAASVRRMSMGRIVIVGAGPCGLGCARELTTLGHDDFQVLEATGAVGGLASSVLDAQGFTWDQGGHVVFSHYGEFDRLLTDVMGEDLLHHERSSFVRVGDSWVPYPFQNNLHHLPPALAEEALTGLIVAGMSTAGSENTPDFASWMKATFGDGIVRQFMQPYNEKVWAHPADVMSSGWIAERVSVVPWQRALAAVLHQRDEPGWGPNNLFAFPAAGGTGEIYRRAAAPLAPRIRFGSSVDTINAGDRSMAVDGIIESYDHLVWTGPLDRLVRSIADAPSDVAAAADALVHNSVTIVGVGCETPLSDDRSWFYFPEPEVPFYRATNFAKYSPQNVPGGRTDRYSSWMTEIASSSWRPLDSDRLVERVIESLQLAGLVEPDAPIVSRHVQHIPYAYPVPTLGRDDALATIQPWLMAHGIYARGRFGAWRYELGNMDHSVKMGVDVARFLASAVPEEAWS